MFNIPSPDDLIGERYRIVRLIGEGGMGAVFEAENIVTQKRVALKWLHPAIASRAESAQRLIREAQAASRIRHSNVVDVYDVITHNGTILLVLELLEGEPLNDVIERGSMKVPEFIALLLQAMRGVAAAHAHGVIHRDVHPGNIFLERSSRRPEPTVKVLDFGISKVDGDATHALTQSGTTMGTPLYMSYEQLCATRDLDVRADIYSFGVILYRALTGRYPFSAESLTELAVQFVTTKPLTVKALRREIPSALDRLVMACVAREREQRPASLEALIEELEPFASEASFLALVSGHNRKMPTISPAHPVTRLHADGASLIPPTGLTPLSPPPSPSVNPPRPSEPAPSARLSEPAYAGRMSEPVQRPSAPAAPQNFGRWRAPAAAVVILLLLGAGAALLLPRFGANDAAAAAPPALPAAPAAALAKPPEPTPSEPIVTKGSLPPAEPTPPVQSPAQPGQAKPPRKWIPLPKPPAPAPGPKPYRRSVDELKREDF